MAIRVTALVISPEKLITRSAQLVVMAGDPCDQESVTAAVRGCDGVISALGPRSLSKDASNMYRCRPEPSFMECEPPMFDVS